MKHSIIPVLLFILLSALPSAASFAGNFGDDPVDLKRVDTLRVLLFDRIPPEELTIYAKDGPITIRSKGHQQVLSDIQPGVTFRSHSGRILLDNNRKTVGSTQWHISTDKVSLIRILHPKTGYRYYRGDITLSISPKDGHIRVLNKVSLENYIASVIGGEMEFEDPEALKAQAVISRTYALWNIDQSNRTAYDLTDHTSSQVYKGELINKPRYLHAAMATHGEILTWSNKLILAVYSSTCGGNTANNSTIWSGKDLPYLKSVDDNNACSISPHFRWESAVPKAKVHALLNNHANKKKTVTEIAIGEKDQHGRVKKMALFHHGNQISSISATVFRSKLTAQRGRDALKSTHFTMKKSGKNYIFKGKGLGHGVGLCQWGAKSFAQSGWNYTDILKFYYNGTDVTNLHFIDDNKISKAK